jgi:hypothetical protein
MTLVRWLAVFLLGTLATAQTQQPQPQQQPKAPSPPSAYTRLGSGTFSPAVTFSGDLSGDVTTQQVIGILNHPLPALTTGYIHWNGTAWVFDTPAGGGGGGSMTWPTGGAGIPNYTGSSAWGTSYNASNPIPANFVPLLNSMSSGTRAAPAFAFASAPEVGLYAGPETNLSGGLVGYALTSAVRASNIVTITTTATGSTGLVVGTTITISSVADSQFDGVFTVASASSNTITYNQSGANASSTGGLMSPWMLYSTATGLNFNRLESSSNGHATRGSIRMAGGDVMTYGCGGCAVSTITPYGTTDQNLLTAGITTGPVKLGDVGGVSIAGPLTVTGAITGNASTATNLSTNGGNSQVWQMDGTGSAQGWRTIATGGTVTVVGGGSLSSTSLMTGGGTTTSQTPCSTCTLDSSGNLSITGQLTATLGLNVPSDGVHWQGINFSGNTTAPTIPSNQFAWGGFSSTSATAYGLQPPNTAPAGQVMVFPAPTSSWSQATWVTLPTVPANPVGTIASGTSALGTGAIASATCATVVTTSATGTLTTDTIVWNPNADPTAVTGYGPSASGSLYIWGYPTANNVNFKVCNNTSASITPAALTLNWRVSR